MNAKFMHLKYLAILLVGVVIVLFVSYDAFSQTPIGVEDSFSFKASKNILTPVTSYIPYEGTCTRDVYDGSDTVCSPGRTERRCRKISGVGEECWEETTERVCALSYEKEDFTVTPLSSGRSLVNVNLSKWAQFDRTKKHTITVKISTLRPVDIKGAINWPQLSNEIGDSLIVND